MLLQNFNTHFYFLVKYENQALKWTKMLIYYCLKMTKNHAKPHQNPMGLGVQIPHPRGIQKSILCPHGGGVQTLNSLMFDQLKALNNFVQFHEDGRHAKFSMDIRSAF